MRKVRFLQIGRSNSVLVENLVYNLNSIQDSFLFLYEGDQINNPKTLGAESPIDVNQLERLVLAYCAKKRLSDYPIAICDCPLEDKVLTSAHTNVAVVTTFSSAETFAPSHPVSGICFVLIDIILGSLGIATPCHYDPRSCPMDFWGGNWKVLREGIAKSDFCSECRSILLRALGQGKISIKELAAIYKLLDSVVSRRSCFVAMPFKDGLDAVYRLCIKPTMSEKGWICNRADEIHETRDIIGLICEQILRSDVVVADLTGKSPNVFYELGYAHAADKDTILISQDLDDIPFDLRHRQVVIYQNSDAGFRQLSAALKMYL